MPIVQDRKRRESRYDDGCFSEGPVCMASFTGSCSAASTCKYGQHSRDTCEPPHYDDVFTRITRAKTQLLQAKWHEAGGRGELVDVWQVRNRYLDRQFRATAHNLALDLQHTSDMIDGWHGTAEENVYSIAQYGFDTSRRSGQAYGAGEYFAKDPEVSRGYAKGGAFMFLCKLLLGASGQDHTWVDEAKYYVVKQRNGYVQALPVYLVQFEASTGQVATWLSWVQTYVGAEEDGTLQHRQRGGKSACEARKDANMTASSTRHLWLGWLAPELAHRSDDDISDDVCSFLHDLAVEEVIPERNGARIGAYVLLSSPLHREWYSSLASRLYHGRYRISVDDAQPTNPLCTGRVCPRLSGPSAYCRGWNIIGHNAWQWGCPFQHPLHLRPTHNAVYSLEVVPPKTAKYDEIETAFQQSAPFHNGMPCIVGVRRVVNRALERIYEQRRTFLTAKHGFTVEKELWHGTNCKAIPELLTHGLQPPSDTRPGMDCPKSGGKGLCTTLCGADCEHCQQAHTWDKCHMYGLGVYLADLAQKSHRYVRGPERRSVKVARGRSGVGGVIEGVNGEVWGEVVQDKGPVWVLASGRIAKKETEHVKWNWQERRRPKRRGVGGVIEGVNGEVWGEVVQDQGDCWLLASGRIAKKHTEGNRWTWQTGDEEEREEEVYSMLFCRVCLGNPYLIEGNLLAPSAMHDVCWCQDPTQQLETVAEEWSLARGHDTYYVRGLAGGQRAGLGVYNSEYIVFQPFQVLPLYKVDYVIS